MKNIEVKGVQFVNKGAELMLVAVEDALSSLKDKNYQLVLSPRNSPYTKRSEYRALQKIGNLYKRIDWSIIDWMIPERLCMTYGLAKHRHIDIVLDASGFAYGEQWSSKMLAHSVRQAKIMKENNKHYIFLPQAMGPFRSDRYKDLIKKAVNYCSLMFIRDRMSYEYVTKITGERDNIILAPDFTNLLEVTKQSVLGEKIFTVIPNGKMLSKLNLKGNNGRDYLAEFTAVARHAQEKGYQVKILNHEGMGDLEICSMIYSKLKKDSAILLNDLGAVDVKSQIYSSNLVLSSRFHGCVSALSQGVPVISTSWSHKYEMLFENYNASELVYDFKDDLTSKFDDVLITLDLTKEKLSKFALSEKNRSSQMWEKVFDVIDI